MVRAILNDLNVDKWLTNLKPSLTDFDSENSGRSVTGLLMRDRIATKRKYELSFTGVLSHDELKLILNAISPVFFTAKFTDPINGEVTIQGYASDKSWEEVPGLDGHIKGLSFSVIER